MAYLLIRWGSTLKSLDILELRFWLEETGLGFNSQIP